MNNKFKRFYELYKLYLPEALLAIIVFVLVFSTKNIPYLNVLIVSFDPVLTGVVAVWIVFYLILNPPARKILSWALLIFLTNFIFVILHKEKIGEIIASLSYAMIFTAVIAEIFNLRKTLRNEPPES